VKRAVATILCVLFSATGDADAWPGGDPARSLSRHPRPPPAVHSDQLNRTRSPVNIVMFANPKSEPASKSLTPKLEVVLVKIGHTVVRVETREQLDRILAERDIHLVLGALGDVAALRRSYTVVPVVERDEPVDRQVYPRCSPQAYDPARTSHRSKTPRDESTRSFLSEANRATAGELSESLSRWNLAGWPLAPGRVVSMERLCFEPFGGHLLIEQLGDHAVA
jgi:hypothetical protein